MMGGMNRPFWMLFAVLSLGISACHDTHLATDVDSALLQHSAQTPQVGIAIQGKVSCAGCVANNGMAIVVGGTLSGLVANGLYSGFGSYQLNGSARPGDGLRITVIVTQSSGAVTQNADVTVPEGGGTITQDFNF